LEDKMPNGFNFGEFLKNVASDALTGAGEAGSAFTGVKKDFTSRRERKEESKAEINSALLKLGYVPTDESGEDVVKVGDAKFKKIKTSEDVKDALSRRKTKEEIKKIRLQQQNISAQQRSRSKTPESLAEEEGFFLFDSEEEIPKNIGGAPLSEVRKVGNRFGAKFKKTSSGSGIFGSLIDQNEGGQAPAPLTPLQPKTLDLSLDGLTNSIRDFLSSIRNK